LDRNFALVIPHYQTLVELSREMAEAIGGSNELYDSLLDRYEPGATTVDLDRMFGAILNPLIELRSKKLSDGPPALSDRLDREWDQAKLRNFAEQMTRQIGFDYNRGRLDIGPSAFCSGTDRFDVRMTTRPSPHIKGILSSSLHEMGHGLYEQNVRPELAGTPLGHGISLAVHESQSRLWENLIGRHPAFWEYFFPQLAQTVDVSEFDAHSFSRAFGAITQNPIRVGSDEVSYNLHIYVRYQLERELISGSLAARDLEEAWNAAYERVLGIQISDVNLGVLQDVHWSRGSFGYFPTYAMGNILGGQIWRQMHTEIPVADCLRTGQFGPVLSWLTQHIYADGRTLSSRELMDRVAGSYLDPQPWLDYVHHRYEMWS
jgi:carboxypeptidase Taq